MESASIKWTVENGVGYLTLNRPDVLNSFNMSMALDLQKCLKQAADDATIRAVLLTGAGRGFCAGQDLKEVLPSEENPAPDLSEIVVKSYNPIVLAIRQLEKPVICAVNGIAAGAGANLAFACDLVLASEKASFVQSFCKLGLVPDTGGTFFLPRLVGMARATALTMLGDKLSAAQALEWGLIYRVCEPDSLMKEADDLAKKLATQPTKGLGFIKRALNASLANDLQTQLAVEMELQGAAGRTDDYQEGVNAFLEKRLPTFNGN